MSDLFFADVEVRVGPQGRRPGPVVDALVRSAADDIAGAVMDTARSLMGRKTGELSRRGLTFDDADRVLPGVFEAKVAINPTVAHGIWHHEGTGVFGLFRRPVRREVAGPFAMNFEAGGVVFRQSFKGQRPNPFLTRAYHIVEHTYAPLRLRQLGLELRAVMGGDR